MNFRRAYKEANSFLEKANEFLHAEVPDYQYTDWTILYCDTCMVLIPMDVYKKYNGSCSKCFIRNSPPHQAHPSLTNGSFASDPKQRQRPASEPSTTL